MVSSGLEEEKKPCAVLFSIWIIKQQCLKSVQEKMSWR